MELDYKSKFTEPSSYSEAITVQVKQPVGENPFRPTNNFQRPVIYNENELPKNYSTAALLTCICCFWPLGIVSLINSQKVDTAISQGDFSTAQRASTDAKNYAIAALVCGITTIIISITSYIVYRKLK
ncbi:proline-rich transmembrane protein 1-like [Hydra vulgaris]|uniref:Proline-rich transmembrane protein 1-like n=1 Tax=Hydra vulgaris TaxID=6087 RepID=A0ABM4BYW7_HYDVU